MKYRGTNFRSDVEEAFQEARKCMKLAPKVQRKSIHCLSILTPDKNELSLKKHPVKLQS